MLSAVRRLLVTNTLLLLLAGGVVAVCGISIYFFTESVRLEVDDLATANSDSVQWSLAQIEVELLLLEADLLRAADSETPDLNEVRKRFDVFYSRYMIVAQSSQYASLRTRPAVARDIASLRAFLDNAVPIIDGSDQQLEETIPQLAAQAHDLRDAARGISLAGVETFARSADSRREHVAAMLARTGNITIGLILVLVILVIMLLFLFRLARVRARDHALVASRLESIVATSLDAILVVDRDGAILDFNGAAERIFGHSRDEAVGRKMDEIIVPEHLREQHRAGMKRYLETGVKHVIGTGRVRLEALRKNGEVFPIELSISTAQSKDGEIFVSYLSDVSEMVAAQDELIEARDRAVAGERAKASFLAVMSHEMRTPLNGLLGTLELLDGTRLTNKQRQFVDVMKTSGKHLMNHVNDVLDISRLEERMVHMASIRFDANRLLRDLSASQRSPAEAAGNELSVDATDSSLSDVVGDPKRLSQILLNLLGNSTKFTRYGKISVHAVRLPDGKAEFSVVDSGIGISEKDVATIFDDFVTVDSSYSRSVGGTGLGLGIARRLTEAMGGKIGVESEPGAGSRFWVRIPLDPWHGKAAIPTDLVHHPAPVQEVAEPAVHRALNVLLVEDNNINRLVARNMLEQAGHHVTEAYDGHGGVTLADAQAFDVILMDISMPAMDGVLATKAIRTGSGASRDVPIIAVTAHALPHDIERFKQAGMNDTLIKPVTRKALNDVLTRVSRARSDDVDAAVEPEANGEAMINLDALRALMGSLGSEPGERLLAKFLEDTDRRLAALPGDIATADHRAAAVAEVHAMAGSAAVFGAQRLRSRLSELETALECNGKFEWSRSRRELIAIWHQTQDEFSRARLSIS